MIGGLAFVVGLLVMRDIQGSIKVIHKLDVYYTFSIMDTCMYLRQGRLTIIELYQILSFIFSWAQVMSRFNITDLPSPAVETPRILMT